MAKLVLHAATEKLLDAYEQEPAHAICLSGDMGVGLGTLAHELATRLSDQESTITTIIPEKGSIPIERIRGLYEQTRSIQQGRRCVIIDDADAMGPEAQNALLKLLEEPVKNVHFILTTHAPSQLLATIRSRAQMVGVLPIDATASKAVLDDYDLSPTEQTQALFLASGLPAELTRLATDKDYFASKSVLVTDARNFLQSDGYTRLTIAKKYTDRLGALEFLAMCGKLLSFMLLKQKNLASADMMMTFDEVMKRVEANGHVRTQLMYLVTKLP